MKWDIGSVRRESGNVYTSESGEVIKIVAGTIAFFPKNWKGTCTVNKKIKKFYCIF